MELNMKRMAYTYLKAGRNDTRYEEAALAATFLRGFFRRYFSNEDAFFADLMDVVTTETSHSMNDCKLFARRVRRLWAETDKRADPDAKKNSTSSAGSTSGGAKDRTQTAGGPTTAKTKAKKTPKEPWRYDQSYDAGPDYQWINEYTYTTKVGKIVTVQGYWRKRRVPKPKPDNSWKFDRNSDPGPGWVWVEGFTRRDGKTIRGHWRESRTAKAI